MQYTLADLTDKASILWLKANRLPPDNGITWREYWLTQDAIYNHPADILKTERYAYLVALCDINGQIWDLEADIRQGREGKLGLEEVGRRAIAIRDKNKDRVSIKNEISKRTGDYVEIKVNHASE